MIEKISSMLCCAVLCIFLKLFLHELLYEFIDSIDLKWCIRHRLTYPVRKKCFVRETINIAPSNSFEVVFHSSLKSFHDPSFLKLFLHHLYYEFINSMNLKWCIRHRLKYSVRTKCFVFVKQSI
jgi:hypothetical protein